MKNLRIYDILTEDGKLLADVQLSMLEDFDWSDVFDKLYDFTTENIQSYSYEELIPINSGWVARELEALP